MKFLENLEEYFKSSKWNEYDLAKKEKCLLTLFHSLIFVRIPREQRIFLLQEYENVIAKIEKRNPLHLQVSFAKNINKKERYDTTLMPQNKKLLFHENFIYNEKMLKIPIELNAAKVVSFKPSYWICVSDSISYFLLYHLILAQEKIKDYDFLKKSVHLNDYKDLTQREKEILLNHRYSLLVPRDVCSMMVEPINFYPSFCALEKVKNISSRLKPKDPSYSFFADYMKDDGIRSFADKHNSFYKSKYETVFDLKDDVLKDILIAAGIMECTDMEKIQDIYQLQKVKRIKHK